MKKTKILATISDMKCDTEFIKELKDLGINGIRLNTAHQCVEDTLKVIKNIRAVSDELAIVVDTKGSEVRIKGIKDSLTLTKGDKITIFSKEEIIEGKNSFATNYPDLPSSIKKGTKLLIDDGDIGAICIEEGKDKIVCEIINSGTILRNKSINVPGVHLKIPTLNEKDKGYINFAIQQDIDFIAHSFVRNKEDVLAIQKMLDEKKSRVKIIAKIENQEGVDNIDEILDNVYGIMIARGDLGIEIPAEKIPGIQKILVRKCIEKKKLVITATQMLHSMIKNPRPTRAEISDVANAVIDGTDVLMLSGETAYGEYPHAAVETMSRVAIEVENDNLFKEERVVALKNEVASFVAKMAEKATRELPIKAIMTNTMTGRTARYMAAHRGNNKIFAECYDKRVIRELGLSYGIFPSYRKSERLAKEFAAEKVTYVKERENLADDDLILILGGEFGTNIGASFIEIGKISQILKRS